MSNNDRGSIFLAGICSFLFVALVFVVVAWCSMPSVAHAQGTDEEQSEEQPSPAPHSMEKMPPFMLMLTVHTPGRQPDGHKNIPMKTLEECWTSAHDFMESAEIPENAVGLSAACGKSRQPKDTNS